jgi:hypothetical protein
MMMYRVFILVGILSLVSSLPVFPQAQPAKPPSAAAPAAAPEEPPPVLSVPKDYRYNAGGRRDPFVNPVPKPILPVQPAKAPVVRPPGLKGVSVAEATITGIVSSREPSMNIVTIVGPGGKKYLARIGDVLFDAVVKAIKPDSVTFTLTATGLDPNVSPDRVLKMHPTPGDEK